jgi:hypothetical protein
VVAGLDERLLRIGMHWRRAHPYASAARRPSSVHDAGVRLRAQYQVRI